MSQQCETPHPSRYFYIPLVGHHDIPLSVPFREIRDNVKKSLLLKSLLPKPYNVVTQNFWGDGNWNDDCDCLDVSGCQANYTSANRVSYTRMPLLLFGCYGVTKCVRRKR